MSEPLRLSIRAACPPDHAFEVFTARIDLWWPEDHRRLKGAEMVLEPGAGGRLYLRTPGGEELDYGRVERWEPPQHLELSWNPGAPPGCPTRVQIRFIAEGSSTRVEVIHSEGHSGLAAAWPSRVVLFDANWRAVLAGYPAACEG